MSFKIVKELLEVSRDQGSKRLLLALYEASGKGEDGTPIRYLAISEQVKKTSDGPWVSALKGITIRRSELQQFITALQSADLEAAPDNKGLTDQEYAEQVLDAMLGQRPSQSQE